MASSTSVVSNATKTTVATSLNFNGNKLGKSKELTETCCGEDEYCSAINSQCLGCTCICKEGFLISSEVSKLVNGSKLSCLTYSGLLPDQLCKTNQDCVTGLKCYRGKCACPRPCKYIKKDLVCDCGSDDPPVAPIIIGLVLGVIIAACWCKRIRRTIVHYRKDRDRVRRIAERDAQVEISTLGAAYGTDNVMIYPQKTQNPYVSPSRQNRTVAPTTPLMPAFNAYGENPYGQNQTPPPPPYPGPPEYIPPSRFDSNYQSQPYASLPLVLTDDQNIQQKKGFQSQSDVDFRIPSSVPSSPPSPSARGYQQLETSNVPQQPRSARF